MAFVKVVKNKAYFMRYQTKFKRRREGKTDYYARKNLIVQDKDRYNTPKYRLVARTTNKRIIAQVVYATIQGDRVFCQADSYELKKWGLDTGFANYASAYATGLLLARRLNKKVGLDQMYEGNKKVEQDYDSGKNVQDRRPFKVVLDVGLKATTKGSKPFAVLKGAADGGVFVPHSTKNFPGDEEDKENKELRNRIMGTHVDNYLKALKGTEKEKVQFNKWLDCLKKSGQASVTKLYTKIHEQIRKSPEFTKKAAKKDPKREHSKLIPRKLTNAQRKTNIRTKIEIRKKELAKLAKKAAKA